MFIEDHAALRACPYIDREDPSCSSHFTLTRLGDAFGDCLGNYHQCPHYLRLSARQPLRHPTVHGHALAPTGT